VSHILCGFAEVVGFVGKACRVSHIVRPVGEFGRLACVLASLGQVAAVGDKGGRDAEARIGPLAAKERNNRAEPVANRRRINEPASIEPALHPVPETNAVLWRCRSALFRTSRLWGRRGR